MTLKRYLPLLVFLQLQSCINSEDNAKYKYNHSFEIAVPNDTSGLTKVLFSVPTVIFHQVHLVELICYERTKHCKMSKYVHPFENEQSIASNKTCDFNYDVPPTWHFERIDVVVFGTDKIIVDSIFKVNLTKSFKYERKIYVFDANNCAKLSKIDVQITKPDKNVTFEQILSNGKKRNVTLFSTNHVVPHDDGFEFDIFYEDHALCYMGYIHGTIDANGRFKRQQRCFFDYYSKIQRPLMEEDDVFVVDDQYIVQDKSGNLWIGLMADWQGTESRRLRDPSFKKLHEQYRISAKYGRVTKCDVPTLQSFSQIDCKVYNMTHFISKQQLSIPLFASEFEIHNLPDGHLQIFSKDTYNNGIYQYWNFDQQGFLINSDVKVEVENCERIGETQLETFLSMDGKEVCAALGCYKVNKWDYKEIRSFEYVVACNPMDTSTQFNVFGL